MRVQTGRLVSPFGTSFVGFMVTVTGDSPDVKRSYDDIEATFKSNEADFKVHEEHTEAGTFKTYIVETKDF